ncbi:UNVERIFIED_CONTAM: Photosynthetic NDH subunit of subcomplex B 5, chloroplastic [Sesamum angustifolium]|uniref:Photosynthetic NDH subunit of subcomplex B 5, chloroplastic n=1 Tax=Sesamum angustifolium TaxID=2727405 RepID=A0AAW2NZA3_9LAMI
MAGSLTVSALPKILSHQNSELYKIKRSPRPSLFLRNGVKFGKNSPTRLFAGLSEVEPDLNEDPKDRWGTNGIDEADFKYGKYDGHHTYYETDDKGSFWGSIAEDYAAIGPPSGFQGLISWLFLPAIAAGMYFNVPGEYLYIGAAVFTVVFCIIEMDKPSEPHNFEPQIYNMERGARDKLMSDYNTMDIWDFNEKYGDLWDFTVKKDDIMKR